MKRIIAIVLSCALLLVGCGQYVTTTSTPETTDIGGQVESGETVEVPVEITEEELGDDTPYEYVVDFDSLDDEDLHRYVRDNLYNEMVAQLNSDEYFIENISTVYISQEYIDELRYNSKPNVYFGYTLEEIDAVYQGTRYVFTLGEEGDTIVVPFESYDDTFEQIIKNVAVGAGVILICVTVSLVAGGTGASVISMVFATAAQNGTEVALESDLLGIVVKGIIRYIETGKIGKELKEKMLMSSEEFKWGAISGVISGATTETVKYTCTINMLKGAELSGLTVQEAAAIQMESGYPVDVIKQFHSLEEYNVFKGAELKTVMINGQNALVRSDIDLDLVDEKGWTNLQRMSNGNAPIDANGKYYELHHIGQEANGTLAILSQIERDNTALHGYKMSSGINRSTFDTQREMFWKTMAKLLECEDI